VGVNRGILERDIIVVLSLVRRLFREVGWEATWEEAQEIVLEMDPGVD
jgi:hypothetical protein